MRINLHAPNRLLAVRLCILGCLLANLSISDAATIEAFPLTGGDDEEGFCPREQAAIAVDLAPAAGRGYIAVQGVVFKPYANQSQVTVSNALCLTTLSSA